MGTFRIDVTVSNLGDRQRSLTLPLLVDAMIIGDQNFHAPAL